MNIETLTEVLLWCTIVNYGFLLYWFGALVLARDWIYGLHGTWFNLTREQFDAVHYGGLAAYKIAVLFLNLVPYLVLRFIV